MKWPRRKQDAEEQAKREAIRQAADAQVYNDLGKRRGYRSMADILGGMGAGFGGGLGGLGFQQQARQQAAPDYNAEFRVFEEMYRQAQTRAFEEALRQATEQQYRQQQRQYAPPPPRPSAPSGHCWNVLGIEKATATQASVRAAFKKLALTTHPDHGGSEAGMRELLDARTQALRECK
jgi:hypothetical protein